MADNPHTGHRRRMLDKFEQFGLRVLNDHEVLEMLLYFSVRQGDTNPAAHALMRRFGDLHAVFEAPREQLEQVEGVGPRSAELIKFVYALFGRYQESVARMERNCDKLTTTERIAEYFVPQLRGEREEVLLAAYLDGAGHVIKCEECDRGGMSQVRVDCGKISREALLCGAAGVAIAHNHPNGKAVPSQEDVDATRLLARYLSGLGIQFVDHCIVARGQSHSMRRAGQLGKE